MKACLHSSALFPFWFIHAGFPLFFLPLRVLSWSLSLTPFLSSLARESISSHSLLHPAWQGGSVSSRTHCFNLNPEIQRRAGCTLTGRTVWGPWGQSTILALQTWITIYPCLQSLTKTWLLSCTTWWIWNWDKAPQHVKLLSEQIQLTASTSWKVFLLFTTSTWRALILISSWAKASKWAKKCNYLLAWVAPIHPLGQECGVTPQHFWIGISLGRKQQTALPQESSPYCLVPKMCLNIKPADNHKAHYTNLWPEQAI